MRRPLCTDTSDAESTSSTPISNCFDQPQEMDVIAVTFEYDAPVMPGSWRQW